MADGFNMLQRFVAEVRVQGFRISFGGLSDIGRMLEGQEPLGSESSATRDGVELVEKQLGGEASALRPFVCDANGGYPDSAFAIWQAEGLDLPGNLMELRVIPRANARKAFARFVERQEDS